MCMYAIVFFFQDGSRHETNYTYGILLDPANHSWDCRCQFRLALLSSYQRRYLLDNRSVRVQLLRYERKKSTKTSLDLEQVDPENAHPEANTTDEFQLIYKFELASVFHI